MRGIEGVIRKRLSRLGHAARDYTDHVKEFYDKIIPVGLQVILYRWQQRSGGQKLHNRYILTDLGGVSFQHGLDAGKKGETDDITRLELDQHVFHCKQYDPTAPTFDQAADPLVITGTSVKQVKQGARCFVVV